MRFPDGSKACTRDFKCLGATSRWTSWTFFDGHSDTIHILGCHNSWNTYGGYLGKTLSCWWKFSIQFEIIQLFGRVARGARLKCVLNANSLATKLLLLRKNASTANEHCYKLQRFTMNELPDLAHPVITGHICNLDTNKKIPSLATNYHVFHFNISKINWMASISNMVIWSAPYCAITIHWEKICVKLEA